MKLCLFIHSLAYSPNETNPEIRAALIQLNNSSPPLVDRKELLTTLALYAELSSFRLTAVVTIALQWLPKNRVVHVLRVRTAVIEIVPQRCRTISASAALDSSDDLRLQEVGKSTAIGDRDA